MKKNAIKIEWIGTVEYIPVNFEDISSNVGNIRSLELWSEGKNARWVEYIVARSLVRIKNELHFSLSYDKNLQEDGFAIENSAWGTTTIIYNQDDETWFANWTGSDDNDGNGRLPFLSLKCRVLSKIQIYCSQSAKVNQTNSL